MGKIKLHMYTFHTFFFLCDIGNIRPDYGI